MEDNTNKYKNTTQQITKKVEHKNNHGNKQHKWRKNKQRTRGGGGGTNKHTHTRTTNIKQKMIKNNNKLKQK